LDKVSIREVTHIKSRHISTSDLSSFLSPHSALQPLSQLYCGRPFIFVVAALAGCYLVLFFLCKSPDLATVPSHLLLQTSVITCFKSLTSSQDLSRLRIFPLSYLLILHSSLSVNCTAEGLSFLLSQHSLVVIWYYFSCVSHPT
jgi:hypothetical protein